MPSSVVYLSKQTSVAQALGLLRLRLNEVAADKVQNLPLIDYINLAMQDVALLLSQAKIPDYGQSVTVLVGADAAGEITLTPTPAELSYATADLSADFTTASLRIARITRLTYMVKSTTIEIPMIEVSPIEFDNLEAIPQKNKELFWFFFGEKLYVRNLKDTLALDSDWGTITVYYDRFPIKLSVADSYRLGDTLDVKDSFIDLVINKAKLMVYEELDMIPPEALTVNINNQIGQIKNSIYEENKFIDKVSKKSQS